VFEGFKSAFNTQKVRLKKKICLVKKIESAFKGPKNGQNALLAKA
jgi:hypothetical protein